MKHELKKVLERIDQNIRIPDPSIKQIIKEQVYAGGKRLRPAYSLLCSHIGSDRDEKRAIAIAAAVECVHMATLIHDDVIDCAEIRHGIPPIHEEHGNKFAIYAGDYLLCLSLSLLSEHASYLNSLNYDVSRAWKLGKILIGELYQLHDLYNPLVTVKNYLSRINGKTARLFAISCFAGAIGSGASRLEANTAWNMGHYIGMAFQILDDILDYEATAETLGKPVMNDVRQGNYTLPLIYALRSYRKELTPILDKKADLSDEDIETMMILIKKSQGIEKAKKLAQKYTEKANHQLRKLPDGAYKNQLKELNQELLTRTM